MLLDSPSRIQARLRTAWPAPLVFVLAAVTSLGVAPATGQESRLGQFDGHGDVGSPKIAGSGAYNALSQEYALSAAGVNMWAQRDEFHFAWKKMKGDFILQARVELLGTGVDPHRKLGLIVRPSLDADAPYADVAVHGDGLVSLQYRRTRRRHRAGPVGRQGRRRRPARAKGNTAASCRPAILTASSVSTCPGRRGLRRPLPAPTTEVVERARSGVRSSGRPRTTSFPTATIGSHLGSSTSRAPPPDPAQLGPALRGAQLDAGRPRAHLQQQRQARQPRAPLSLRPRHPPAGPHRHRLRQPEQQRPRPLLRRDHARHQRPEHGWQPVHHLHAAGDGRHAEAHHAAEPVLPARLVAGREVPRLPGGRNGEFDIYKVASDGSGRRST